MKPHQRTFRWIIIPILTLLFICAFIISSGNRIVLTGNQWLDDNGVDVIYPPKGMPIPMGYASQCRYGGCYQCIELVIRLYAETLGYDRCNLPEFKDEPGCTDPTPNDVLHRWPGAPKADPNCPYSRDGSLWTPCDLRALVKYANQAGDDVTKYKLFKDLQYFENGSTTPPRPGDILLYTYQSNGDHTAIINRVGGNRLEIVEQNWPDFDASGNLTARRLLNIRFENGEYWIANTLGWIHSPKMAEKLTVPFSRGVPMTNHPYYSNVQWNRDQDTVYFYLSTEATSILSSDPSPDKKESTTLISEISKTNALNLTNVGYSQCILKNIFNLIPSLFSPPEIRSLDFTLKYTGSSLWVRAWLKDTSNTNSGWIRINNINCGWDGNLY